MNREENGKIPAPSTKRLSMMYQYLLRLCDSGLSEVSSSEIGERLEITAHTVRKDISYLNMHSVVGAKYKVKTLKDAIAEKLNFNQQRKACVVGLGKIGGAILQYQNFFKHGFSIVAGFDSNVNRIETLQSEAKLYPSYMISEVVTEMAIELAILCVPLTAAQLCVDRLADGGIKGIVNFSSALVKSEKNIIITDIDVTRELRILTAMIALSNSDNIGEGEQNGTSI